MTYGALRRGACCGRVRGIGAAGSGPRRCAIAQEEWARLPPTCGESPPSLRGRQGAALLRSFTLFVHVSAYSRVLALGRSAWRAEGAPLKPWRKLIASGGWSRCVKIRAGAGLGGLGLLPRCGWGLGSALAG
jgi:hypothetical protein